MEESSLLNFDSLISDEVIGISDVPIFKINKIEIGVDSKPIGSAYILINMSVTEAPELKVNARVCVDTGADMTICSHTFIIKKFGDKALQTFVKEISNPPRLKSASGHPLKIFGCIELNLYLGEYEMSLKVMVYENKADFLLLGADAFYDRLIFDRGKYLMIAEGDHPPIPIVYQLENSKATVANEYYVAPKSEALIKVQVSKDTQMVGQQIMLSPISNSLNITPFKDTVSMVDDEGNALMIVENVSEDILKIPNWAQVATVAKVFNQEGLWAKEVMETKLKDLLPPHIKIRNKSLLTTEIIQEEEHEGNISYIHDKKERKDLLDGTGEGLPAPPAAESIREGESNKIEDPDQWLNSVEHSHLSEEEWNKLKALLLKRKEAFSKTKTEVGCCKYFKLDLPLKPGTGFLHNKPRHVPFKYREIAQKAIDDLLEQGIIRPSRSPHSTNLVVVKKKTMNGVVSHRICVDLRQVNQHTIPNSFPNYWIEEAMEKINGAYFRTALDFKNAFHQIMLTDEAIPVTAFYFNNALYEYVRAPFGHVCAMNAFCCLMALLCSGYQPSSYYADDLMITTPVDIKKTRGNIYDLHLEHIDGMLERIIDANLKLVAHKCQWAYDASQPMEWLGFTLENNLLKPQESKVKAIKEFPIPITAKQVISFVSLASFYRRFIKDFARIAKPMHDVAKLEPFEWTEKAQEAFEALKEAMCSDTVLRMPRQGEVFQLYTDASHIAIGAVLCQIDPVDKKSHPCAYGSRKFNDQELKLSTPCKELLAIVYALNLWSFYICGNPVHIFSDCRAWTFLKVQSGVSGKISRLALLVAEYDITVSFVQGVKNKAADGLSRAYDTGLTKCDDQVSNRHPALEYLGAPPMKEGSMKLDSYLEVCENYIQQEWPKLLEQYKENNDEKTDLENVKNKINNETNYVHRLVEATTHLHMDRVVTKQMQDQKTSEINRNLDDETEVERDLETTDSRFKLAYYNVRMIAINDSSFSYPSFLALQKDDEFCQLKIELVDKKDIKTINQGYLKKRGILMRKFTTKDGQVYYTVCIPINLVPALLNATHGNLISGHLGKEKFYITLRRKYYWPKMRKDIVQFHDKCVVCQYNDKYPVRFTSGHVIRPMYPLHVVHCDLIVGLPKAIDKSYAIFLLYDGFTRHVYGIPLASEKASYVAKKFMSHYVSAYGLMWALHSDNARNLDGAFIRHLATLLGVVKTSTPPHNPRSNPTETMCGAIAMLIRKGLLDSDRKYWPQALPLLLNAINNSVHTATGYTPNELFFGHFHERSMIPIVPFESESANITEYHQKLRRFQEIAFRIARARNEKRIQDKKKEWDKNARIHHFEVGDFILVKNLNPTLGPGETKLRAKFVGPYRIIKVYPSSLVVVPWTENARLEEYYKDPNLFRYMHRGDIKPFYTKQVAVGNCKPYKARVIRQKIVDPIVLSKFLTNLNLADNDELLSVRDINHENNSSYDSQTRIRVPKYPRNTRSESDSYSSDSDDSSHGQNPVLANPVAPAAPVPAAQPPLIVAQDQQRQVQPDNDQAVINDEGQQDSISDSSASSEYREANEDVDIEGPDLDEISDNDSDDSSEYRLGQLFDLIEVNEEDEQLLRDLIQHKDKKSSSSSPADSIKSQATRLKLLDLEKLIISPDDNIRHQAEYELGQLLEQHRKDKEVEMEEKEIISDETNSEEKSQEEALKEKVSSHISRESDSEDSEDKSSENSEKIETQESDEESMNSAVSHTTLQSVVPEDSWPNPSEIPPPIDNRQRQSVVRIETPGCRITVSPENLPPVLPPRPREIRGRAKKDIWEWVSQSPDTPAIATPQVDRRGRIIKPRPRYCPEDQEQREKELRLRARQRLAELAESTKAEETEVNFQAQAQGSIPIPGTSRTLASRGESTPKSGTKSTGTKPKTKPESATVITETPVSKKTHLKRPDSTASKKSKASQRDGKSDGKGWE